MVIVFVVQGGNPRKAEAEEVVVRAIKDLSKKNQGQATLLQRVGDTSPSGESLGIAIAVPLSLFLFVTRGALWGNARNPLDHFSFGARNRLILSGLYFQRAYRVSKFALFFIRKILQCDEI